MQTEGRNTEHLCYLCSGAAVHSWHQCDSVLSSSSQEPSPKYHIGAAEFQHSGNLGHLVLRDPQTTQPGPSDSAPYCKCGQLLSHESHN